MARRAALVKKRRSVLKGAVLLKTGAVHAKKRASVVIGQAWAASKRLRGRSGVLKGVLDQSSAAKVQVVGGGLSSD